MKRVIALILGGGQGKRLFPLTKYRSKPAVPIGGKYRLIDIAISNCLHSGLKDIFVITQFNSESLNNHINNTYRFDFFSRAFVKILAAEQTVDNTNWLQGTADAVRKNITHLDLTGDEDILILSGDQLYRMDYRDLIQFHRRKKADLTISVVPVKRHEAQLFGILRIDRNGRITSFQEKPTGALLPAKPIASMGVYVFRASVLKNALANQFADFGNEVIPSSIKKFGAYGYEFNGYWKDIGTIKAFYDVHIDFTTDKPHFSFFFQEEVFTRPRFLPPVKMMNCEVKNCLVAEGSVIVNAWIEDSVIGLRTIVGERCRISRTVVMGADYYEGSPAAKIPPVGIGSGSVIERAIIDKNARIGRNVLIQNKKGLKHMDGQNFYIRNGIIIIPKNAVIPNNTKIP